MQFGNLSALTTSNGAPDRAALTMLLAEDEYALRLVISRYLRKRGFTVLECPDGEAARMVLASHSQPIELLLVDVGLPRLSGVEVAKVARTTHGDAAVIYMSGYGDMLFDDALRLRPNERFISKPFLLDDLGRVLDDILLTLTPVQEGAR
jgi:DNA-binding response OmpR family regulator